MILPDKITPPSEALIYKALEFNKKYLNSNNTPNKYHYSKYQSDLNIDEYIKIMDILFLLGLLTINEVDITNDIED